MNNQLIPSGRNDGTNGLVNAKLAATVRAINAEMELTRKCSLRVCYYFRMVRNDKLYKDDYQSFEMWAKCTFALAKAQAHNYANVGNFCRVTEKSGIPTGYSIFDKVTLVHNDKTGKDTETHNDFGVTKLLELWRSNIAVETLQEMVDNGAIFPGMTVTALKQKLTALTEHTEDEPEDTEHTEDEPEDTEPEDMELEPAEPKQEPEDMELEPAEPKQEPEDMELEPAEPKQEPEDPNGYINGLFQRFYSTYGEISTYANKMDELAGISNVGTPLYIAHSVAVQALVDAMSCFDKIIRNREIPDEMQGIVNTRLEAIQGAVEEVKRNG